MRSTEAKDLQYAISIKVLYALDRAMKSLEEVDDVDLTVVSKLIINFYGELCEETEGLQ